MRSAAGVVIRFALKQCSGDTVHCAETHANACYCGTSLWQRCAGSVQELHNGILTVGHTLAEAIAWHLEQPGLVTYCIDMQRCPRPASPNLSAGAEEHAPCCGTGLAQNSIMRSLPTWRQHFIFLAGDTTHLQSPVLFVRRFFLVDQKPTSSTSASSSRCRRMNFAVQAASFSISSLLQGLVRAFSQSDLFVPSSS